MVRHKTQSGAKAQASIPVAGQTYGNAADQQQLQQAMPAPNGTPPVAPAAPVASPAQPAQAAGGPVDIAALLARAQGQGAGAGLLAGGSSRPGEPVTAGMALGPGPGPEAVGFATSTTPGQRFLRKLADALKDPALADLADRVAR